MRSGVKRRCHSVDHPGSTIRRRAGGRRRLLSIPAAVSVFSIRASRDGVKRLKNASRQTVAEFRGRGEKGALTAHPSAPLATIIPAASSAIADGTSNSALRKVLGFPALEFIFNKIDRDRTGAGARIERLSLGRNRRGLPRSI